MKLKELFELVKSIVPEAELREGSPYSEICVPLPPADRREEVITRIIGLARSGGEDVPPEMKISGKWIIRDSGSSIRNDPRPVYQACLADGSLHEGGHLGELDHPSLFLFY